MPVERAHAGGRACCVEHAVTSPRQACTSLIATFYDFVAIDRPYGLPRCTCCRRNTFLLTRWFELATMQRAGWVGLGHAIVRARAKESARACNTEAADNQQRRLRSATNTPIVSVLCTIFRDHALTPSRVHTNDAHIHPCLANVERTSRNGLLCYTNAFVTFFEPRRAVNTRVHNSDNRCQAHTT